MRLSAWLQIFFYSLFALSITVISVAVFNGVSVMPLLAVIVVDGVIFFIFSKVLASRINATFAKIVSKNNELLNSSKKVESINYVGNISEVAELVQSVNSLAERIERGREFQKEVVFDYAHEFRTPLALLLTNLEAISDGIFKPTKTVIDNCKLEVIRLNDMSEYLYNLADIKSYKIMLDKREIDIVKVVRSSILLFKEYAKLKDVKINFNAKKMMIYADSSRLQSIIINLISNAIKYSKDSGRVDIKLKNVDDKTSQLIVSDNGLGIADADMQHIFDFKYRGKLAKRKNHGHGVGLSIVKSFVSAHGWKIDVKSRRNVGTTFTITMSARGNNE